MTTKLDQMKRELTSHLTTAKETFATLDNQPMVRTIDAFLEDFARLRYTLSIIGSLKRGKSTLLNTLMGRPDDDISPIDDFACTSAIIRYNDKNCDENPTHVEQAAIHFKGRNEPEMIALGALRQYVTEEGNPKNAKQVHSVDVYGSFPEWGNTIRIVDTPGQNSIYDYHDTLLTDFLPGTDAILFLVSADLPLDDGDLKLLKELNEQQRERIFFVLTKWDRIDESERPGTLKYVRDVLKAYGFETSPLYTVSARPVFRALKQGADSQHIEALKAENGLTKLENDLGDFIRSHSAETEYLAERAKTIIDEIEKTAMRIDSLYCSDIAKGEIDRKSLEEQQKVISEGLERLQTETAKKLTNFERDWNHTISNISRTIDEKTDILTETIAERISKYSLVEASFKCFKIKKDVLKQIRAEIQAIITPFETNLASSVEKLSLDMNDELSLYVKRINDCDDLKTATGSIAISTVAGGAVVAGGVVAGNAVLTTAPLIVSMITGVTTGTTAMSAGWLTSLFGGLGFTAANAATVGINIATVSTGIATMGLSLVGTLAAGFVAKHALNAFQEKRVPALAAEAVTAIKKDLETTLTAAGKRIVQEYNEKTAALIAQENSRLEEVERLLNDDSGEELEKLRERTNQLKLLQDNCKTARAMLA